MGRGCCLLVGLVLIGSGFAACGGAPLAGKGQDADADLVSSVDVGAGGDVTAGLGEMVGEPAVKNDCSPCEKLDQCCLLVAAVQHCTNRQSCSIFADPRGYGGGAVCADDLNAFASSSLPQAPSCQQIADGNLAGVDGGVPDGGSSGPDPCSGQVLTPDQPCPIPGLYCSAGAALCRCHSHGTALTWACQFLI